MGQLYTRIYDFFQQHRWAFIVFLLLLMAFEGWFASQIHLEEDINKVIPASEKNEKLISVLQNSKFADRLVVCISQKENIENANPEMLIAFAESFIDSINNSKASALVSSIESKVSLASMSEIYEIFYENLPIFLDTGNYRQIEGMLNDSVIALSIKKDYEALISPGGFVMRDFILKDPLSITPIALKKLENLKVSENFELYNDYIVSADRRNLLFFIISKNPATETFENAKLLAMIDDFGKQLGSKYNDEASLLYFGSVAASISNAGQIKRDIITTVSIAVLLLILFIGFYFRRKLVFLLIFLPALLGGAFALAMLYLIKTQVSAISLGLGSVMLGISVDYAIHFLSHFKQTGNVKTVIKDIAGPVMMSSITTASAFLCLLVLRSEALRDLGLFAALSVFSSAVFTLVILPAFFKSEVKKGSNKRPNRLAMLIEKIASYSYDRKGKLVLAIIFLFIVFIFTSRRVEFESSMDSMNYLTDDLKKAENYLDSISSYKLRSVFLVSAAPSLDKALEMNEALIAATDSLHQLGIVNSYISVSGFYPSAAAAKDKIDAWIEFWDETKQQKTKQSIIETAREFRFKENTFDEFFRLFEFPQENIRLEDLSLVRSTFLDEYISEKDSLTMVTTIFKVAVEDKPAIYAAFENNEEVIVFDRQSLTSSFMEGLRDDFNVLILLSLVVVFLLLTVSFGRIELGIITFIPLLISWTFTLGIMGLLEIRFNIFNIIISTFIFGLGIDYAIFCMRGLLQEYQYGHKKLNSYKISILLSGVTTIVGIGVLIFAKHPALQSIAISAIIGITSVIFITYTILPRLFRFLVMHEGRQRKTVVTLKDFIFSVNTFMIFLLGVLILDIAGLMLKFLVPMRMKTKKMIFHRMLSAACWTIVYGSVNIKKIIWNRSGEDFRKPAIIVCNHQSHLDTVVNIMQNPRMILLTAPWVQKSMFFGWFIRFADFYSTTEGVDDMMGKIKYITNEGYSVFVFPEGTRSPDLKIGRFHQGAFYMAKELELDILPIISYGSGNTMAKFEPFLKTSPTTMTILPRIRKGDPLIKETPLATARSVRHYMMDEYKEIRKKIENPAFFRKKVIRNYLFRGPVLEWYMKLKIRMEDNYVTFHKILPVSGIISDIGCGYGFMSYMLQLMAPERKMLAYDYDIDKIETARNVALNNKNFQFEQADARTLEPEQSDAFILADVLHYMPEKDQEVLIRKCAGKLNNDGIIIIRDADVSMKKKHAGTRLSEWFSTRLGFNRTITDDKMLYFSSKENYLTIFAELGLDVDIIDHTKRTSNLVYVLRKRK